MCIYIYIYIYIHIYIYIYSVHVTFASGRQVVPQLLTDSHVHRCWSFLFSKMHSHATGWVPLVSTLHSSDSAFSRAATLGLPSTKSEDAMHRRHARVGDANN